MKKITTLILVCLVTICSYAQELVTNGNFESGVTGWTGNAANVVAEGGNKFNAANVGSAGNPWDVNLSYILSLTAGKSYKLTFDAWSDRNRTLIAGIGLNEGSYASDTKTINLTNTSQTFNMTLTCPATSANCRVLFDMGAAVGYVGIDNVSLQEVTVTVTPPSTAAPTPPSRLPSEVVSIYSDAYTNITMNNFDAGWCGGAASTEVMIAGNKTLKKNAGIACHGIDFTTNKQNLTSFTHIHFDFYTTDTDLVGDVFNVKLVNFNGGNSEANALEVNINGGSTPALVANQWISVDVPITALGGVITGNLARNDVAQIGITTANVTNVWYDNIYLHKNTTTGLDNNKVEDLIVYYNNESKMLTLKGKNEVSELMIRNLVGQHLKTIKVNANTTTLSLADLSAGNYFVIAKMANGQISTQKITKL